jgi:hypothetical protein
MASRSLKIHAVALNMEDAAGLESGTVQYEIAHKANKAV